MNIGNNLHINTVVLIEDDQTLGTLLKYKLEENGIQLIQALSGKEAFECFKIINKPVLVIVDYELNDITGDVLIQQLKEMGHDFPFIAITGAGSEEIAGDFLRLGAEDYIIKDLGFLTKIENSIYKTLKSYSYKIQIEEQQKIIAQNEERYRMIFENIQDVYLILDQRYHIKEISPSIENILQIPSSMLIHQPVFYIIKNRTQWKDGLKKLLQNKTLLNHEVELYNKAKNIQATCQINAKLIEMNGSKCAVITLRDISELKKLQKQLLNIVSVTEEKERREISENLHDQVAPLFATSKMYLMRAFDQNKDPNERQELFNEALSLLDEGIQHIRNLSSDLISQVLSQFGLEKALMQFIQKHSKIKNTNVNFHFNTQNNRFEPAIENVIFRTTTELIHNSFKHSQATLIELKIEQNGNLLFIFFQDNGIGFDFEEEIIKNNINKKTQGLRSFINRLKMLSGEVEFKRLEKGISYTISIPL
jgi:PAS domain S-box-containing protein